MFGADKGKAPQAQDNKAQRDKNHEASRLYIGIVQARFNHAITEAMAQQCTSELCKLGVQAKHIDLFKVPGALEIPVTLQALAEKNEYDALIAIGCVIRGQTYHFELVANESAAGIMQLSLDYKVPIVNAILTTETVAQAEERIGEKSIDAAIIAIEMALLINKIS